MLVKETLQFLADIPLPENPRVLTLGVQQGVSLPSNWQVETLDISDYEGASIIHDLNTPICSALHNRYDLIIDGGTLEHVFNLLGGLENCFQMLKVGGYFVSHQTMNFCGHGFYQLCPEFFYKWSRWIGMSNPRCWVYSPISKTLKYCQERPERREEFETFTHCYILFSAMKAQECIKWITWPQQAGPSKAGRFEHWFWNTKVWSRLPVPNEEKVSRKIKN